MTDHPTAVDAGYQAIDGKTISVKLGMRRDRHLASAFEAMQQHVLP